MKIAVGKYKIASRKSIVPVILLTILVFGAVTIAALNNNDSPRIAKKSEPSQRQTHAQAEKNQSVLSKTDTTGADQSTSASAPSQSNQNQRPPAPTSVGSPTTTAPPRRRAPGPSDYTPPPPPERKLIASPAYVTPTGSNPAGFTMVTNDGSHVGYPKLVSPDNSDSRYSVLIQGANPPEFNYVWNNRWNFAFLRNNNTQGIATYIFTSLDSKGNEYTGSVVVNWLPVTDSQ
jgi:hypothetical protein